MSNQYYPPGGGPYRQVPGGPPPPPPKIKRFGFVALGVASTVALLIGAVAGGSAGASTATPTPAPTVTVEVEKRVEVPVPGPTKTVTTEPEPTEEPQNTEFSYDDFKTTLEDLDVTLVDLTADNLPGECFEGGYGTDYAVYAGVGCSDVDVILDALIEVLRDREFFSYYVRGGNWVIVATTKSAANNARDIFGGKLKKL